MKVFIIGPGGVGKSTVGKILAEKLGYELIDLDIEFINTVGHIGSYIDTYGYEQYCHRNSKLFYSLLAECSEKSVLILSSGFLVHKGIEALTIKHYKSLQSSGISILLLPSRDINETTEIVTKRQLSRGFGLTEENERKKIRKRYPKYTQYGDIKIYSQDKPEKIADEMKKKLADRLAEV